MRGTMSALVKRYSTIPMTVGSMMYDYVDQLAGLGDVVCFQPYARKIHDMDQHCHHHLAIAKRMGKPLICTETCCGSFNDEERGKLAEDNIRSLERHKIGWIAWHLCEGRFVSATRNRIDSNSVHSDEGYMPFVLADGTTRPGQKWLEV